MNWGTTTTIPTGPEGKLDHWSYYGRTPAEGVARQNAGLPPMTDAQHASVHAQAPQETQPVPTGPAVFGGTVSGAQQPAAQNPYMPAQPTMQAQPAQPTHRAAQHHARHDPSRSLYGLRSMK